VTDSYPNGHIVFLDECYALQKILTVKSKKAIVHEKHERHERHKVNQDIALIFRFTLWVTTFGISLNIFVLFVSPKGAYFWLSWTK
jgi:hypothetical protein